MLHDFAREVLRDQPKDICEYGALYFKALEEVRDTSIEIKHFRVVRVPNSITRIRALRFLHQKTASPVKVITRRCLRDLKSRRVRVRPLPTMI